MNVEWRPHVYGLAGQKLPPAGELVWIVEEFYRPGEATIGYHDGFTWRTWYGSDDCSVSRWAPIEYPGIPS